MYLGRPVLTIAPEGALAALVRRHRLGPVLTPRDPDAIAAFLADTLRAWCAGRFAISAAPVDIERYHRRALVGRFAEAFRAASALAREGARPRRGSRP
jgi:hypothetical protein